MQRLIDRIVTGISLKGRKHQKPLVGIQGIEPDVYHRVSKQFLRRLDESLERNSEALDMLARL